MAKKEKKEKKGKKGKPETQQPVPPTGAAPGGVPPTDATLNGVPSTGVPPTGTPTVPLSQMAPEQMTPQQLEQAIRESNDPENRLKKLHSPLGVKSCLLNILFLVILTLGVVILMCYIKVDKFNFGVVVKDMSDKFGITSGFQWLWATISSWFGGGG